MAINISTFQHQGQDIEVMLAKGKISYVFDYKGKHYGNSVKIAGKKTQDVVDASFALILNYLETYAKVRKARS